jgi:hydrogenase maturation protease
VYFVRDTFLEIKSRREEMKIAVIGIGQSLRGDDAAGLAAVHQWQEKFPETATRPEVRVEASELPGLALIEMLNDVDVAILIDAVQSGAAPGTIHRIGEKDLSAFSSDAKSAHGWGVAETLTLSRQLNQNLPPIRIIGIEAAQMMMGASMSEAVEAAIPHACEAIEQEIKSLL